MMAATATSTTSATNTTLSSSSSSYAAANRTPRTLPKTPSSLRSLRRPSASASTPNLNAAYASHSRLALAPAPAPGSAGLSRKASLAALTPSSLASIPDVTETYGSDSLLSHQSNSHRTNMAPTTPGRPSADDLAVGDTVEVPGNMQGVVRFVGPVQGKKGVFAGVELDPDFAARGKNNGDVDGVSYFTTSISGAGIFLPVAKAVRRDSLLSIPMTPSTSGFRAGSQNANSYTPPTPGVPRFSASVGPGARAPSPQGKRPGTSGGRTSLPRPDSPVRRSQATPGPRPSIGTPAKGPARYGSPTTSRFAQSVRGTAGDPSKKTLDRKPSLPARSASALGFDEDATPVGLPRSKTNGNIGTSFRRESRSPSRAASSTDDETARLRAQLEERDRQLKEQSSTLAEMESSLTELQTLMEGAGPDAGMNSEFEGKDTAQLRGLLREKNDKISMLTSEFDAHRADFRSTIDALEMASTETERVYERRIEELMADIRELESRNLDVDSVASQLRQLEELVQELEEGLEDARRGEAEARGEVEFLRGEVERTRTELIRERQKAGPDQGAGSAPRGLSSKELEQKEDEIRGLKAIIHSLSRDSATGGSERPQSQRPRSIIQGDLIEHKIARDNLERQVAELQSILEQRSTREEELEQELEKLRGPNSGTNGRRSSLRDSRDTVVLTRSRDTRSPEAVHKRGAALDAMAESDAHSSATENSTLWCEICETSGHDILTCTNMFGPEGAKQSQPQHNPSSTQQLRAPNGADDDAHPAPLSPAKSKSPLATPTVKILPNPMEYGPVAGKESGIMDPEKWCAVCERDGHDSVDCPFEDAF